MNNNIKYKTDLKKRCFQLSLDIIKLIDTFPNKRTYWIIGDQILRCGTSIGANLTEAQGSGSKKDFKRFNEIALKSTNETLYWLNILIQANMITSTSIHQILSETDEIARMIAKGILKMKGRL